MHEAAEDAFKVTHVNCDSSAFIQDITKVSNLMIEEGYKYHFIHKSVQEFHAANYIKSRPEEAAIKFYSTMINAYYEWRQEINFLQQIDSYRYAKYLFTPSILGFFAENSIAIDSWIPLTENQLNNMLRKLYFHVPKDGNVEISDISYGFGQLSSDYYMVSIASEIQQKLIKLEGHHFFSCTDDASSQMIELARRIGEPDDEQDSREYIKLNNYEYFKHKNLLTECYKIINEHIENIHSNTKEKIQFILREENSLSL